MAGNDGERRMVFDIRGRRKNVVKVVYAVLALLMGASLFLVVGPAPLQDLFGVDSASNSAASQLEEQAETLERKVKKDPDDAQLLLNLTRARVGAGNALAVSNPETGAIALSPESRHQYELASEGWSKYLKATDEPSPSGAQAVSGALFGLAQTARTGGEAEANIRAAADAQKIVAQARPSLGSLSTLAIFQLYSFDYKGAQQSKEQGLKLANTKFERENLENEFEQIGKRAREFQKQLAEIEKEAKKAREKGQAPLANPLSESNPLAQP